MTSPNLLFVFGDQWRAQAFGYAGDGNARTPCVDAFSRESVDFCHAVSGCPVCSPYRASLLSGQYPLTHGMVVNDQRLHHLPGGSFADALNAAGYDTGWIGKWHIHGCGRKEFVPPEHRLGFRFWRGYECTHSYNQSFYYDDNPRPQPWEGYDAEAQTACACEHLAGHDRGKPFALFLSWGPPHDPYQTAPEAFRALFKPDAITLRPNVPPDLAARARESLAGYYAHGAALDACFGRLLETLDRTGLADNTIVVFTSDHGDLLGSHGLWNKQWPQDESIRVPFLLRWPAVLGRAARGIDAPIDAPDLMPTLLGLCGASVPSGVQGRDFSPMILGREPDDRDHAAVLSCYTPFHQMKRDNGGREYRGLRTVRHTYVRSHAEGPWYLYDNAADPYQLRNLVNMPEAAAVQQELDTRLQEQLQDLNDPFESGPAILARYQVRLNAAGDVFYE
jgi:arylsulfatase A-like enzyme